MNSKDYGLELKYAAGAQLISDGTQIEGHASLFGLTDQGGDIVQKGAYAASLKRLATRGDKVRMLCSGSISSISVPPTFAKAIFSWNGCEDSRPGISLAPAGRTRRTRPTAARTCATTSGTTWPMRSGTRRRPRAGSCT